MNANSIRITDQKNIYLSHKSDSFVLANINYKMNEDSVEIQLIDKSE